MTWALQLACLFLAANWAAVCSTDSPPLDTFMSEEKSASPYARAQQVVESHFQLGSGAGSVSKPHGNENNEPAIRAWAIPIPWTVTSVSRESRNTEVTARNLQDIQFKSISGLFSKLMNTLASIGVPLFYVALWPISVMLIFVYINMLPRVGDRDLPPRFDPANNRYSFRAWT